MGLKYIACIILFFIAGKSLFSQDIIFFTNGTKDSVKVLEIGPELITYKKAGRMDGPVYKVLRNEVVLIEFGDGEIEVIRPTVYPAPGSSFMNEGKTNIFSLNVLGLFLGNIHLGYEHIFGKGNFGLRANLVATVVPDITDIPFYLTGFDFNFYPTGQGQLKYFLGPSLRVGIIDDAPIVSTLFNNGIAYSPQGSSFYMGGQLGLGISVYDEELMEYGFIMLNIGTRF